MAEQETPNPKPLGDAQHDRESTARQPGRPPRERASEPDLGESDAARRQARQDPLQRRDR